jgi:hypothetical protein
MDDAITESEFRTIQDVLIQTGYAMTRVILPLPSWVSGLIHSLVEELPGYPVHRDGKVTGTVWMEEGTPIIQIQTDMSIGFGDVRLVSSRASCMVMDTFPGRFRA